MSVIEGGVALPGGCWEGLSTLPDDGRRNWIPASRGHSPCLHGVSGLDRVNISTQTVRNPFHKEETNRKQEAAEK